MTKQLTGLQESDLEFNDPPRLVWVRVKDAVGLLWVDNPKMHDIGGTILSIQKHGYQEFPKYDINLTNVNGKPGAIKAGNGRIESLFRMEQDKMELPRGLARDKKTGDWVMAIGIGVDAKSEALAKAYAIDSNNLTMAGGDFTGVDISNMWNPQAYLDILKQLGQMGEDVMPISVDPDTLDNLIGYYNLDTGEVELDEFTWLDNPEIKYRVCIDDLSYEEAEKLQGEIPESRVEQYRVK